MSVSLWQRRSGGGLPTERVDLVVVGGGIVGLAAALEAQRRGQSVVVLERHSVGSGASGRNAGYLMRGMADSYAVAAQHFGRDTANAVWKLSEHNLGLLRHAGADGAKGFVMRPSCLLALNERDEGDLRESHTMLLADGFASELLEAEQIPEPLRSRAKPRVGLVNPNDAVCDPMELLSVLRAGLKAPVIEPCEVCDFEAVADGVRIVTNLGQLHASRTLVCTNAWASELFGIAGVIEPCRAQMLAAKPLGGALELGYSYYINRGDEYLRSGPGGLLLMGGARRFEPPLQQREASGTAPEVQAALEQYVRTLAVDDFEVVARWSGVMGVTPDDLPIAGPAGESERVWVCAGFSGHGMSLGFATAQATVGAMLDGQPALAMYDPGRFNSESAT